MKFTGFLLFSTLEYIAFFYFVLVLFRFDIKENLLKFGIFSLVLSFVSNTLQIESMRAISPLIHLALMIFFITFLLRVHIFNASIMIVTSYVIYYMVQWLLSGVVIHFKMFDEILPYTYNAFIMQTASAIMIFLFALVTYFQKGGFSFVDNNSRLKRSKIFVRANRYFIIFLFLSITVVVLGNIAFIVSKTPPYLIVSIFLFISLLGLIYISVKRDEYKNG